MVAAESGERVTFLLMVDIAFARRSSVVSDVDDLLDELLASLSFPSAFTSNNDFDGGGSGDDHKFNKLRT